MKRLVTFAIAILLITAISVNAVLSSVGVSAEQDYVSISLGNKKVLSPPQVEPARVGKIESKGKNYEISLANGDVCTIGDKANPTTFRPTIELSRYWYDSYKSLKLALPTTRTGTTSVANNVLTWNSGQNNTPDVRVYFTGTNSIEYEIILKAPPSSNTVSLALPGLAGMNWYYQPPLTESYRVGENGISNVTETDVYDKDGDVLIHREVKAVGSYAIYDNEYSNWYSNPSEADVKKNRKLWHLYRPLCIDAKDNKFWASYIGNPQDTGYLTITIDQKDLDTATYPIVVDPTFGSATDADGATTFTLEDMTRIRLAASGGTGTGVSISVLIAARSGSQVYKAGLYEGDASYVATSANSTGAAGWRELAFTTSPSILNQNYLLCVWGNSTSGSLTLDGDTTGGTSCYHRTAIFTDWPDPLTMYFSNDDIYSIYCTYTESASYDISLDVNSKAFGIVAASTTYYAKGTPPNNPVQDGDCTFTLTNDGDDCDIDLHGHSFTGGVGWTLTSGAPGSNTVRLTVYYSGQNPASGTVVTTSDQEFYDGLTAASHIHLDFKFETGTFTDGVAKSTTLTLTAVAPD